MRRLRGVLTSVCLLAVAPTLAIAGEEDEIVTGCHFSNAEWGVDAIRMCIDENHALRKRLLVYPPEHQGYLERCRRGRELGWHWVQRCVDGDIEAQAALSQYPAEAEPVIKACQADLGHRGPFKVKACVDAVLNPQTPKQ